ncbi:hypothetical protein BKA62DRAFT_668593 [Auriculariales sp. MPI-PUGE-AT-0066]|nr:hypothetical protein BKA62DRAFT_668593 [Auriculariales sp. MPI-PUGE-AT-0066]
MSSNGDTQQPAAASTTSHSPSPTLLPLNRYFNEDEDTTVTGKRITQRKTRSDDQPDDLALLAVSAQITEISYSISDIQTRIFEIQELRHRNLEEETGSGNIKPANGEPATNVIDQALINLDERLEAVSTSISAVDDALGITPGAESKSNANPLLLRKHVALIEEWDSVQTEAETLRDELKEDKWLAVFRTVSEQAEGMMSSLEKGVTQCRDFIFQFQRHAGEHPSSVSSGTSMQSINYETFTSLLQSFEAKKKYYMPSITKVLSVLDKGVRDRVTKNGECLRRHAELRARWHNLKERIGRTDAEMEGARRQLVNRDLEPSEAGSTVSHGTSKSRNGFLSSGVTTSTSRSPSSASRTTISRSMSPLSNFGSGMKRFATKVSDKFTGRTTPSALLTPPSSTGSIRVPSTESPTSRKSGFFQFRSNGGGPPETPPRNPARLGTAAPRASTDTSASAGTTKKERWNSSTRVEAESLATVKAPGLRKRPSNSNLSVNTGNFFRSPSPAGSFGGRATPSGAGTIKATATPSRLSFSRPVSRGASYSAPRTPTKPPQTPSEAYPPRPPRATTPNGSVIIRSHTPGGSVLPRARPTSPSHIPGPRGGYLPSAEAEAEYEGLPLSMMQRAFSPPAGASPRTPMRPTTPSHRPRTPSASLIPLPRMNLSADSRSNSPSILRSHTPEATIRARAGQIPFLHSRPSVANAPSSFKDSTSVTPPRPSSRTSSRASTSYTPGFDHNPVPNYVPCKTDPLDLEVAKCVNGFPHSFLVERIDPPLRTAPKNLEEIRAQYAVSNALARKVITCRLVIISRSKGANSRTPNVSALADGGEQRKVMCRVGGGWLDLQMYLLNRQAGMS